jgi:hypothetical protein
MGQAQEEAELARLRADFNEAEQDYDEAVRAHRAADPWDNDREVARRKAAGDRLAALRVKLITYEKDSAS